jgi:hypothetical protein
MGLEVANETTIIRDERGRWVFAVTSASSELPTSGVPEGAIAYDVDSSTWLKFSSGSWANMAATMGTITATLTGNVTGNVTGDLTGDVTGGLKRNVQELTGDGAITVQDGVCVLNKVGVIAATLADPTDVVDDGKVLEIISVTAQAHTVDNSAGSGFNGAGAGSDVGTFGAAAANMIRVLALGGVWYVLNNVNVTLA